MDEAAVTAIETHVPEAERQGIMFPYSRTTLVGLHAVALHASKDSLTPVITTVRVTPDSFIATNRYTIAIYQHTGEPPASQSTKPSVDESASVLIPRSAAEWLVKQTPKMLNKTADALERFAGHWDTANAVIRATETSIGIHYLGSTLAMFSFEPVMGNFPPVVKLFPENVTEAGDNGIMLDHSMLLMFVQGAKQLSGRNGRNGGIRFRFTASNGKPEPVLITFEDTRRFYGLIQPKLIKN